MINRVVMRHRSPKKFPSGPFPTPVKRLMSDFKFNSGWLFAPDIMTDERTAGKKNPQSC